MSNIPHASAVSGEHAVPEVAMGYCFLAKDGSDASLTVLVIKDRDSSAILSHPVLRTPGRCRGTGCGERSAARPSPA
eukprot:8668358-Alexandrium_andersonii.AAC.1